MTRPSPTFFLRLPPPPRAEPGELPSTIAPASLERAPALERLLCRADPVAAAADWRREAFALIAAEDERWPGVAAAALHRAFGAVEAGAVFLATPVHYVPTMTRLHLAPEGVLALAPAEAAALAADFAATFGGDPELRAAPSGTLFCVFDRALEAETRDPDDMAGRDVGEFQPSGRDAAPLRRLMSEIEMWLHAHALNRARAARGAAPVGGLWLWGGGAPLAHAPRLAGWGGGEDALLAALDGRAEFARDGRSGAVRIAAIPGGTLWGEAEARWLAPAAEALAARRLGRILVSAGRRTFAIEAAQRLRFWRRARPWWEILA